MKVHLHGKVKQEEITFQSIKDKNDYLVDFEFDNNNQNLYALTYHGQIFVKGFSRNFQSGIIPLDVFKRESPVHFTSILKISEC